MEKLRHWTHLGEESVLRAIASDFIGQIETAMEDQTMDRKTFIKKAGVTAGRVSQVFNNPSNMNLRSVVKYANVANRKVAIVTYDDSDPDNKLGPIDAGVFAATWKNAGRPRDLFGLVAPLDSQPYVYFVSAVAPKNVEWHAMRDTRFESIPGAGQRINVPLNLLNQVPYAQAQTKH
jgi:hypothetical protein